MTVQATNSSVETFVIKKNQSDEATEEPEITFFDLDYPPMTPVVSPDIFYYGFDSIDSTIFLP